MISSDQESLRSELGLPMDMLEPPLTMEERLIRALLMIGFVTVLAVEAWLLWQVWLLWS